MDFLGIQAAKQNAKKPHSCKLRQGARVSVPGQVILRRKATSVGEIPLGEQPSAKSSLLSRRLTKAQLKLVCLNVLRNLTLI
jgi:hypothetical protein